MIYGLGTEIVEVLRIGRMIERHGARFLDRVFTEDEQRTAGQAADFIRGYASRWAIKRAAVRAIGVVGQRKIPWKQMETAQSAEGGWQITFRGSLGALTSAKPIGRILISTAACRSHITAVVIALQSAAIPEGQ